MSRSLSMSVPRDADVFGDGTYADSRTSPSHLRRPFGSSESPDASSKEGGGDSTKDFFARGLSMDLVEDAFAFVRRSFWSPAVWRRAVLFFDGTMDHTLRLPLVKRYRVFRDTLRFFECFPRAVGQVVFANNPLTGMLIACILVARQPRLGVCGLLSLVTGTLAAIAFLADQSPVHAGIYGYNQYLYGAACGAFVQNWTQSAVIAMAGGVLTTLIQVSLVSMMNKAMAAPPFTLPFIVSTMTMVLSTYSWGRVGLTHAVAAPQLVSASSSDALGYGEWGFDDYLVSIVHGVSNVFLVEDVFTGVVVVVAIGICSRVLAASCVVGSALGMGLGVGLGVRAALVRAGVMGFNPALVVAGVVFNFRISPTSIAVSIAGALLCFATQCALMSVSAPVGAPTLTLPFVVALVCCWMTCFHVKGMKLVAKEDLSTPENHFKAAITRISLPKTSALLSGYSMVGAEEHASTAMHAYPSEERHQDGDEGDMHDRRDEESARHRHHRGEDEESARPHVQHHNVHASGVGHFNRRPPRDDEDDHSYGDDLSSQEDGFEMTEFVARSTQTTTEPREEEEEEEEQQQ